MVLLKQKDVNQSQLHLLWNCRILSYQSFHSIFELIAVGTVIISGTAHVLSANRTLILRKIDDAVYEALSMEMVSTTRFAYFIVLGELLATDWAFDDVIVLLDFAEWD